MTALGVDPGPKDGAAALVRPDGSSETWEWHRTSAGYRVRHRKNGAAQTVAALTLGEVMLDVLQHAPYIRHAAVEAVHVGKVRGAALVALAEAAGAWVGLASMTGAGEPGRPVAATWRRDVLRVRAGTPAGDCDRAAVAAVQGLPLVGRRGETVSLGLRWLGEAPSSHEADALCIAAWAAGRRA